MYSQDERCIYRKSPLAEVICQLRFPEILSIETNVPAQFQEAIRQEFPLYSLRKETPPPVFSGAPGNLQMQPQKSNNNYQFVSADGIWRINLTSKFISLSCTRHTCWEDFAGKLDRPLAAFIQIYKPAFFQRVGLRYLNFISRKDLELEGIPYRQLIEPQYLGILGDEDVNEATANRSSMDAEFAIRGGCKCKLHAGPGLVKRNGQPDSEVKFVFDMDVFMDGRLEVKLSAPALQTLHGQAFSIFRGAVTDTLHQAMEPERI